MKISIITATFNSSQSITACIKSIFSQTYTDVEHIIIDGSSTDGTVSKINELPNRVSYVISEPDKGIYDALNKGILAATGDIIGFVHSDDQLASAEILQKVVDAFMQTGADGIFGNLVFVNKEDMIVRTWTSSPFKSRNIKFGWMPPHPALFLRKEVFLKHGLFDITFKIAGDYDFMLRLMLDKEINIQHLQEVITRMRLGGISTGSIGGIVNKMKEDIRVLRKNKFRFPMAILFIKNIRKVHQLF